MKEKISVNEFTNLLREQVKNICTENQLSIDTDKDRGEGFSHWCIQLLQKVNNLEDDSEDILMGGSSDLKIDFILTDEVEKSIHLVQTKYVGMGKKKKGGAIDIDDLEVFCGRHKYLQDSAWVRKNGNKTIVAKLLDYKDFVEDGYKFNYTYITTADSTERTKAIVSEQEKHLEKLKEEVNIQLIDFTLLKEMYVNSLSSELSIPDEVSFDLPQDKFIIKEEPLKTLLAIVKGSSIINLYKQYKKSLFTWNIRGHLGGEKGINKNIKNTAINTPENFYYYNNGISAVCTDFTFDKNKLTAKKFQIINGAQTVGSLYLARDKAKDCELLLKVTVSGSVSTEKGFNADIIRFNNTQNKVNLSDFRSNDKIQKIIETNFSKSKAMSVSAIQYLKKRGVKKESGKINITLENLARIRYAYLHNPCEVISSAQLLWDNEKNGKYHKAFGVDGEIPELITDEIFKKSFVLPVCLFVFIEAECKQRSKDPDFKDLKRFKYHFLSLSKLLLDFLIKSSTESVNISKLIKDKGYMKLFIKEFLSYAIPNITDLINTAYADILEGKSTSINAPLRDLQINRNKWEMICKNFNIKLKLLSTKDIKNFILN